MIASLDDDDDDNSSSRDKSNDDNSAINGECSDEGVSRSEGMIGIGSERSVCVCVDEEAILTHHNIVQ